MALSLLQEETIHNYQLRQWNDESTKIFTHCTTPNKEIKYIHQILLNILADIETKFEDVKVTNALSFASGTLRPSTRNPMVGIQESVVEVRLSMLILHYRHR
jgi:hypothetical protein